MRDLGKGEQGQALLEMALVLPLFFLLLFGVVEMGRIGFAYISVNNAARAGARVASVGGTDQEIVSAVDQAASVDATQLTIAIAPEQSQRQSGQNVDVNVSYPVHLIIPVIEGIIPNPVVVQAHLRMRLE